MLRALRPHVVRLHAVRLHVVRLHAVPDVRAHSCEQARVQAPRLSLVVALLPTLPLLTRVVCADLPRIRHHRVLRQVDVTGTMAKQFVLTMTAHIVKMEQTEMMRWTEVMVKMLKIE